jgi:hypothetical protein
MRAVALVVGCSLFACTDHEPIFDEVSSGVVVNNRLAGNTLAENRLAGNTLAGSKLAGTRLANNQLTLNETASELLATEDGREVLSFIVSCALDETVTVVGEFEGETLEFFGDLGLAPDWLDHRLDHVGKGWVSACLFARVNASQVAIPISLRGPHPRLTADDDEKALFSLQEGAFYGNFFTNDDDVIDWNACRGSDQATLEIAGLTTRDCAEPAGNTGLTQCNFNYAGDCGEFATRHACKTFNGTFYGKCQDEAVYRDGKHGWGRPDHPYKQIITVYVLGE